MLLKKRTNKIYSTARLSLLILLFSGLLSIPYLDFERFYFTWFAFVPILFAIENASLVKTYLLGTLGGFLAFASGMYWIADFINIAKGSVESVNIWLSAINWFYCSQLIAIVLVLLNLFRKYSTIHDFVLFPVLFASMTSIFPMLFSMRLADSQINFQAALQATEFLGAYALDAIIALTNIMLFQLLRLVFSASGSAKLMVAKHVEPVTGSSWSWGSGSILITSWLSYGLIATNWWSDELQKWQSIDVGIVQPNEAPTLDNKKSMAGYSQAYPPEMEMTERLATLDPDLIVWPEAHPKQYLNNEGIKSAYQKSIKEMGVNLMFQDIRKVLNKQSGGTLTHYNSAVMLNPQGEQVGLYNKIKRIPFGEYIPLLNQGSWLSERVKSFLGRFLNQYSKGQKHQLFKLDKVNLVPLICYETTFPEFVANSVSSAIETARGEPRSSNKGTIIVALSNDGWFGSTHQPYQHIMGSVLRAVENRMPLVHAANNGPSIVVTPHGKIIFSSPFRTQGGYITKVPVAKESKASLYSRYPSLFSYLLYGTLLFIFINTMMARAPEARLKKSKRGQNVY